jgi:hypothetical protein
MKRGTRSTRKQSGKSKARQARANPKSARNKPQTPLLGSAFRKSRESVSGETAIALQQESRRGTFAAGGDLGGCGSHEGASERSEWRDPGIAGNNGQDRRQAATENGNSRNGTEGSDAASDIREEGDIAKLIKVEYLIHLPSMDDPPHPKQKQFVESSHKRKIIRAGRRAGKTVGSAIMAVLAFLDGKSVDYGAPVIDQAAKFWHEVVMALAEPLEFGVFRKKESEKRIYKPDTEPEQYIHCHTVWNPDVMRGGSTDLLILDEFQMMNEDTWELVCLPRLADRNGDAVLIYTPPSMRMRAKTNARDPLHASKMFKKYKDDPRWLCLHFTSHDNPNISEEGIREVSSDLTQLGYRQEIMAEDIEEVPGALWKQSIIDALRVSEVPREALPFLRVVVGVDPSGSSTNEAGVVAAAKGRNGHGYVLADKSLLAATPRAWAQAACSIYRELQADRIVAERNYGGDMVLEVLRTVSGLVSYKEVVATRGKQVRAEPIFALYEKGIIHHVGIFDKLEEEQCSYVPGQTRDSPNRMDACVWAFTELFPESLNLEVWLKL